MTRLFWSTASAVVVLGLVTQAQAPAPPPNVLRIFEENVKVGKSAAHDKHEANWVKAWAAGKHPGQSLAMKTIAGPPQAWFIEGHESMAAVEKLEKDLEKMTALSAQNDLLLAQEDRKSTRLNSSHIQKSRMPSSA